MKTRLLSILLCMAFTASLSAQTSNYDNLYYEILNKSKKNSDRNKSEKYRSSQYSNKNQGSGNYNYRDYNRPRIQQQRFILIQTHFRAYSHSRPHNPIWYKNAIQQIFQTNQNPNVRYHFYPEPYVNYDQRIDIYLENVSVSPDEVSQTICEKYSKIRRPIAMHEDGKLRGEPYAIMKGQLITVHQSKNSQVRLNIKITDKSGRRILKQDFLRGQEYWSNNYAEYAGRRSLAAKCGPEYGCALPFPSDYSLLEKAIYSIGPQLIRWTNQRSYY